MTQEIIEMAKQAHLPYFWETGVPCNLSGLEAFAKLVEDAAFKRWAEQTKLAVESEREACAKHLDNQNTAITDILAAEIRARGQA
jgi:hypothetical protein